MAQENAVSAENDQFKKNNTLSKKYITKSLNGHISIARNILNSR